MGFTGSDRVLPRAGCAGSSTTTRSREGFSEFLERPWSPLFRHLRKKGESHQSGARKAPGIPVDCRRPDADGPPPDRFFWGRSVTRMGYALDLEPAASHLDVLSVNASNRPRDHRRRPTSKRKGPRPKPGSSRGAVADRKEIDRLRRESRVSPAMMLGDSDHPSRDRDRLSATGHLNGGTVQ